MKTLALVPIAAALMGCQASHNARTATGVETRPSSAATPTPGCAAKGTPRANGEVIGCLETAIVQRIVRANFGTFRKCYQDGLRRAPSLAGRIAVKFTIDRQGTVREAGDGGSELADGAVVDCVVAGFRPLRFPAPDGGTVVVVYPIVFQPGDS